MQISVVMDNKTRHQRISSFGVAKKKDEENAFCTVCCCSIKFSVQGGQAIDYHAKSSKHSENCRLELAPSQLHLQNIRPTQTEDSVPGSGAATIQLYSLRDRNTRREILWSLKCVASDFPAACNDGISNLFSAMFEGAPSIEDFSLSRTKFTYLLTDGLAPYFRDDLQRDLFGQYYTLYYDETVNKGDSKELRTGVRYWSPRENKIVSAHLRTFFIEKATGEIISEKIISSIDEYSLPLNKLIMLGSDGPNVNLKVHRLISEKVKECRSEPLANIGTCNIHIVHNAFCAGLQRFGDEVSDLVIAIYYFFRNWPSRWEDFENIQDELGGKRYRFIKHVSSRWLTLEDALLWDPTTKYFLEFIPKQKPQLQTKSSYMKIKRMLQDSKTPAQLLFVKTSASLFSDLTKTFQKEEPLIHVLHGELRTLALKLINKVVKPEVVKEKGVCLGTLHVNNLLPVEQVAVGQDVSEELDRAKVSKLDQLTFCKNVRDHVVAACKHLIEKSALKAGSNVRSFRCLSPKERRSTQSHRDIINGPKLLPVPVDVNRLLDEWKLLQLEDDKPGSAEDSIDKYWTQFFTIKRPSGDDLMYPNVTCVVKAALSLSHGQANVERGFSQSSRTLSADRAAMSERTLDSYMVVKNALKAYHYRPELVSITKELITSAQGAHANYVAYQEEFKRKKDAALKQKEQEEKEKIEEEKRKEALDNSRKRIIDEESKLKERLEEETKRRRTGLKLLEEGNERLKTAIKNKDLEEVSVAQAMIEAAKSVESEAQKKHEEVQTLQKNIDKKKSQIISKLCPKK